MGHSLYVIRHYSFDVGLSTLLAIQCGSFNASYFVYPLLFIIVIVVESCDTKLHNLNYIALELG